MATSVIQIVDKDPKNLLKGQVAKVGTSSLRPKIYKQLTLSGMIAKLQHFAHLWKAAFIKQAEVAKEMGPVPCPRWRTLPAQT